MNKTLLTVFAVMAAITLSNPAAADHKSSLRKSHELQREHLDDEYRELRKANRRAYHRERDALREQRSYVLDIDCRDTRIAQLRLINRQLSELSRSYARRNREIVDWFHAERDALRHSYELARRETRRPIAIQPPVVHHADDCRCSDCRPPAPAPTHFPRARNGYPHDHHTYHDHRYAGRRQPTALGIAGLILSLLD